MNPIITFTTLFGLLAVELAITMPTFPRAALAAVFLAVALVFVYRSFYGMRIESGVKASSQDAAQHAA
jgi:K(+)-stimulated pyrophosphate-energized sodium pump